MSEQPFNTHLAAEFLVMSALYRLGANALLTPGNKKTVDIVVEKHASRYKNNGAVFVENGGECPAKER
jgi:hypothetical protein